MPLELDTFLMIAGGLLGLAVLLLGLGIVMYRNQNRGGSKRIAEEKKTILPDSSKADRRVTSMSPDSQAGRQAVSALELLRVMRDPIDGRLQVRLMGDSTSLNDLNEHQRDQLTRVLEELADWVEASEDAAALEIPAPEPAEDKPAENGPFADSLPDRVELRDVMPFRKKNVPKLEDPPPPPRSIAEQINELIQINLAESPLTDQAVRLTEEPGGGLEIVVNGRIFSSIEEVDVPEVKSLIKRAVREWNEQNRLKPNT